MGFKIQMKYCHDILHKAACNLPTNPSSKCVTFRGIMLPRILKLNASEETGHNQMFMSLLQLQNSAQ